MRTAAIVGVVAAVSLLVPAASCESGHSIVVRVQTDLAPGVEFDEVVVAGARISSLEARVGDDYSRPTDVVTLAGLSAATPLRIEVSLRLRERVVLLREVVRSVQNDGVMLVIMSRNCLELSCPSPSAPDATECRGRSCVRPDCDDEVGCGSMVECASDAECGLPANCVTPRCVAGLCLSSPSAEACGPGGACVPGMGCVDLTGADAGSLDAWAPDAVVLDGGSDATSLDAFSLDASSLDARTDAHAEDAPTPIASSVRVGTAAMSSPANVGCAGSNAAPLAGAPVTADIVVRAISLSPFDVPMTGIELFPGDQLRPACDADCVASSTDVSGVAAVSLPRGGWFSYRLPASGTGGMAVVPVLGYFFEFAATPGERVSVTAMGTTAAALLAAGLNRELTSETALVSGTFLDCDGEPVAYTRIRMFRGAAEICPGGCPPADTTMPRVTGLSDSSIPARSPDGLTRFAGRFAASVPAAGGPVRIEAWGSLTDGAPAELLGCEEVTVDPATVTVTTVGPLRADYRPGSSCERP